MKKLKKALAVLMAVMLVVPNIPTAAAKPLEEVVFDVKEGSEASPAQETDSSGELKAAQEEASQASEAVREPEGEIAEQPATESESVKETETPIGEEPPKETEEVQVTEPFVGVEPPKETEEVQVTETSVGEELPKETEEVQVTEIFTEEEIPTETETLTEEETAGETSENLNSVNRSDAVTYNTGRHEYHVVAKEDYAENEADIACFEADGSYTIQIPEQNPFFPYEVQFTYHGEAESRWFMTPDASVEIGGHTFYVSANFDGTAVTQMSLCVAGQTVVVYPERKSFTKSELAGVYSLLPLKEVPLTVDLSEFTPVELTMVSIDSIFTGESILTNKDKVVWTYENTDDQFKISQSGDLIDLSYKTSSSSWKNIWQMIVGDADQLAAANIRYLVDVKHAYSYYWIKSDIYIQDDAGVRSEIKTSSDYYNDYEYGENYDSGSKPRRKYTQTFKDELNGANKIYMSLNIDASLFAGKHYDTMKAYQGKFASAGEIKTENDITGQLLCNNMSVKDAGYVIDLANSNYHSEWITLVTYNQSGKVTGCMPFELYFNLKTKMNGFWMDSLYKDDWTDVVDSNPPDTKDGCTYYTSTLYKEYPANDTYNLVLEYYKNGVSADTGTLVIAAFEGQYSSIADALNKGAKDIKDELFNIKQAGGYAADYSQGIFFTVFVGEDGSDKQEIYKCNVKTVTGTKSVNDNNITLESGTWVHFKGLNDSSGKEVASYVVRDNDDSYAEQTYPTILVGNDADLTKLAPLFDMEPGINLYTPSSSVAEKSGESIHDFSNGAVQYTAAAEDGKASRNYWLQVVKASSGVNLYINSLKDAESETEVRDGVIYSKREVMLDSFNGTFHDILLVNMGTEPVHKLKAELSSDVLELDEYWTLSGNYSLSGFTTTQKSEGITYGQLSNMAKIRLNKKSAVTDGTNVSGTLTIKSGDKTLMVLNLTGIVGDPCITTKEIPQAVKYVPYGSMIQNNNKYSWNKVSYSLISGTLPAGMEVKENGEIYGVPTEAGEFTFKVRMKNSNMYNQFSDSTATYTLTVLENTDDNVENATNEGYKLTERIPDIRVGETETHLLVSEGTFDQFVDLYLDGVKLQKGVDYTAESGSTRITIKGETLDSSKKKGKHTIGIEFRTSDDELKRAAQNYNVTSAGGSSGGGNNESNGGDSGNNENSAGSASGGGTNNGTGANAPISADSASAIANPNIIIDPVTGEVIFIDTADGGTNTSINTGMNTPVQYTIQTGDTLWKLAERYYGSGAYWQKIYDDNASVIANPNKIYAGQVITIYPLTNAVPADTATEAGSSVSYYVVESGDTLWKIAKKIYGRGKRWREIYEANADIISNPGRIYSGQLIRIP